MARKDGFCYLALSNASGGTRAFAQTQDFTLQPVAAGVWAAIATDAGPAGGNPGFIVGNDAIAVIDTFEHPTRAETQWCGCRLQHRQLRSDLEQETTFHDYLLGLCTRVGEAEGRGVSKKPIWQLKCALHQPPETLTHKLMRCF